VSTSLSYEHALCVPFKESWPDYSQLNTLAIFVSIAQESIWEEFAARPSPPAPCVVLAAFYSMICRKGPAQIPFREMTGEKLV
jgi:hypothetical protein